MDDSANKLSKRRRRRRILMHDDEDEDGTPSKIQGLNQSEMSLTNISEKSTTSSHTKRTISSSTQQSESTFIRKQTYSSSSEFEKSSFKSSFKSFEKNETSIVESYTDSSRGEKTDSSYTSKTKPSTRQISSSSGNLPFSATEASRIVDPKIMEGVDILHPKLGEIGKSAQASRSRDIYNDFGRLNRDSKDVSIVDTGKSRTVHDKFITEGHSEKSGDNVSEQSRFRTDSEQYSFSDKENTKVDYTRSEHREVTERRGFVAQEDVMSALNMNVYMGDNSTVRGSRFGTRETGSNVIDLSSRRKDRSHEKEKDTRLTIVRDVRSDDPQELSEMHVASIRDRVRLMRATMKNPLADLEESDQDQQTAIDVQFSSDSDDQERENQASSANEEQMLNLGKETQVETEGSYMDNGNSEIDGQEILSGSTELVMDYKTSEEKTTTEYGNQQISFNVTYDLPKQVHHEAVLLQQDMSTYNTETRPRGYETKGHFTPSVDSKKEISSSDNTTNKNVKNKQAFETLLKDSATVLQSEVPTASAISEQQFSVHKSGITLMQPQTLHAVEVQDDINGENFHANVTPNTTETVQQGLEQNDNLVENKVQTTTKTEDADGKQKSPENIMESLASYSSIPVTTTTKYTTEIQPMEVDTEHQRKSMPTVTVEDLPAQTFTRGEQSNHTDTFITGQKVSNSLEFQLPANNIVTGNNLSQNTDSSESSSVEKSSNHGAASRILVQELDTAHLPEEIITIQTGIVTSSEPSANLAETKLLYSDSKTVGSDEVIIIQGYNPIRPPQQISYYKRLQQDTEAGESAVKSSEDNEYHSQSYNAKQPELHESSPYEVKRQVLSLTENSKSSTFRTQRLNMRTYAPKPYQRPLPKRCEKQPSHEISFHSQSQPTDLHLEKKPDGVKESHEAPLHHKELDMVMKENVFADVEEVTKSEDVRNIHDTPPRNIDTDEGLTYNVSSTDVKSKDEKKDQSSYLQLQLDRRIADAKHPYNTPPYEKEPDDVKFTELNSNHEQPNENKIPNKKDPDIEQPGLLSESTSDTLDLLYLTPPRDEEPDQHMPDKIQSLKEKQSGSVNHPYVAPINKPEVVMLSESYPTELQPNENSQSYEQSPDDLPLSMSTAISRNISRPSQVGFVELTSLGPRQNEFQTKVEQPEIMDEERKKETCHETTSNESLSYVQSLPTKLHQQDLNFDITYEEKSEDYLHEDQPDANGNNARPNEIHLKSKQNDTQLAEDDSEARQTDSATESIENVTDDEEMSMEEWPDEQQSEDEGQQKTEPQETPGHLPFQPVELQLSDTIPEQPMDNDFENKFTVKTTPQVPSTRETKVADLHSVNIGIESRYLDDDSVLKPSSPSVQIEQVKVENTCLEPVYTEPNYDSPVLHDLPQTKAKNDGEDDVPLYKAKQWDEQHQNEKEEAIGKVNKDLEMDVEYNEYDNEERHDVQPLVVQFPNYLPIVEQPSESKSREDKVSEDSVHLTQLYEIKKSQFISYETEQSVKALNTRRNEVQSGDKQDDVETDNSRYAIEVDNLERLEITSHKPTSYESQRNEEELSEAFKITAYGLHSRDTKDDLYQTEPFRVEKKEIRSYKTTTSETREYEEEPSESIKKLRNEREQQNIPDVASYDNTSTTTRWDVSKRERSSYEAATSQRYEIIPSDPFNNMRDVRKQENTEDTDSDDNFSLDEPSGVDNREIRSNKTTTYESQRYEIKDEKERQYKKEGTISDDHLNPAEPYKVDKRKVRPYKLPSYDSQKYEDQAPESPKSRPSEENLYHDPDIVQKAEVRTYELRREDKKLDQLHDRKTRTKLEAYTPDKYTVHIDNMEHVLQTSIPLDSPSRKRKFTGTEQDDKEDISDTPHVLIKRKVKITTSNSFMDPKIQNDIAHHEHKIFPLPNKDKADRDEIVEKNSRSEKYLLESTPEEHVSDVVDVIECETTDTNEEFRNQFEPQLRYEHKYLGDDDSEQPKGVKKPSPLLTYRVESHIQLTPFERPGSRPSLKSWKSEPILNVDRLEETEHTNSRRRKSINFDTSMFKQSTVFIELQKPHRVPLVPAYSTNNLPFETIIRNEVNIKLKKKRSKSLPPKKTPDDRYDEKPGEASEMQPLQIQGGELGRKDIQVSESLETVDASFLDHEDDEPDDSKDKEAEVLVEESPPELLVKQQNVEAVENLDEKKLRKSRLNIAPVTIRPKSFRNDEKHAIIQNQNSTDITYGRVESVPCNKVRQTVASEKPRDDIIIEETLSEYPSSLPTLHDEETFKQYREERISDFEETIDHQTSLTMKSQTQNDDTTTGEIKTQERSVNGEIEQLKPKRSTKRRHRIVVDREDLKRSSMKNDDKDKIPIAEEQPSRGIEQPKLPFEVGRYLEDDEDNSNVPIDELHKTDQLPTFTEYPEDIQEPLDNSNTDIDSPEIPESQLPIIVHQYLGDKVGGNVIQESEANDVNEFQTYETYEANKEIQRLLEKESDNEEDRADTVEPHRYVSRQPIEVILVDETKKKKKNKSKKNTISDDSMMDDSIPHEALVERATKTVAQFPEKKERIDTKEIAIQTMPVPDEIESDDESDPEMLEYEQRSRIESYLINTIPEEQEEESPLSTPDQQEANQKRLFIFRDTRYDEETSRQPSQINEKPPHYTARIISSKHFEESTVLQGKPKTKLSHQGFLSEPSRDEEPELPQSQSKHDKRIDRPKFNVQDFKQDRGRQNEVEIEAPPAKKHRVSSPPPTENRLSERELYQKQETIADKEAIPVAEKPHQHQYEVHDFIKYEQQENAYETLDLNDSVDERDDKSEPDELTCQEKDGSQKDDIHELPKGPDILTTINTPRYESVDLKNEPNVFIEEKAELQRVFKPSVTVEASAEEIHEEDLEFYKPFEPRPEVKAFVLDEEPLVKEQPKTVKEPQKEDRIEDPKQPDFIEIVSTPKYEIQDIGMMYKVVIEDEQELKRVSMPSETVEKSTEITVEEEPEFYKSFERRHEVKAFILNDGPLVNERPKPKEEDQPEDLKEPDLLKIVNTPKYEIPDIGKVHKVVIEEEPELKPVSRPSGAAKKSTKIMVEEEHEFYKPFGPRHEVKGVILEEGPIVKEHSQPQDEPQKEAVRGVPKEPDFFRTIDTPTYEILDIRKAPEVVIEENPEFKRVSKLSGTIDKITEKFVEEEPRCYKSFEPKHEIKAFILDEETLVKDPSKPREKTKIENAPEAPKEPDSIWTVNRPNYEIQDLEKEPKVFIEEVPELQRVFKPSVTVEESAEEMHEKDLEFYKPFEPKSEVKAFILDEEPLVIEQPKTVKEPQKEDRIEDPKQPDFIGIVSTPKHEIQDIKMMYKVVIEDERQELKRVSMPSETVEKSTEITVEEEPEFYKSFERRHEVKAFILNDGLLVNERPKLKEEDLPEDLKEPDLVKIVNTPKYEIPDMGKVHKVIIEEEPKLKPVSRPSGAVKKNTQIMVEEEHDFYKPFGPRHEVKGLILEEGPIVKEHSQPQDEPTKEAVRGVPKEPDFFRTINTPKYEIPDIGKAPEVVIEEDPEFKRVYKLSGTVDKITEKLVEEEPRSYKSFEPKHEIKAFILDEETLVKDPSKPQEKTKIENAPEAPKEPDSIWTVNTPNYEIQDLEKEPKVFIEEVPEHQRVFKPSVTVEASAEEMHEKDLEFYKPFEPRPEVKAFILDEEPLVKEQAKTVKEPQKEDRIEDPKQPDFIGIVSTPKYEIQDIGMMYKVVIEDEQELKRVSTPSETVEKSTEITVEEEAEFYKSFERRHEVKAFILNDEPLVNERPKPNEEDQPEDLKEPDLLKIVNTPKYEIPDMEKVHKVVIEEEPVLKPVSRPSGAVKKSTQLMVEEEHEFYKPFGPRHEVKGLILEEGPIVKEHSQPQDEPQKEAVREVPEEPDFFRTIDTPTYEILDIRKAPEVVIEEDPEFKRVSKLSRTVDKITEKLVEEEPKSYKSFEPKHEIKTFILDEEILVKDPSKPQEKTKIENAPEAPKGPDSIWTVNTPNYEIQDLEKKPKVFFEEVPELQRVFKLSVTVEASAEEMHEKDLEFYKPFEPRPEVKAFILDEEPLVNEQPQLSVESQKNDQSEDPKNQEFIRTVVAPKEEISDFEKEHKVRDFVIEEPEQKPVATFEKSAEQVVQGKSELYKPFESRLEVKSLIVDEEPLLKGQPKPDEAESKIDEAAVVHKATQKISFEDNENVKFEMSTSELIDESVETDDIHETEPVSIVPAPQVRDEITLDILNDTQKLTDRPISFQDGLPSQSLKQSSFCEVNREIITEIEGSSDKRGEWKETDETDRTETNFVDGVPDTVKGKSTNVYGDSEYGNSVQDGFKSHRKATTEAEYEKLDIVNNKEGGIITTSTSSADDEKYTTIGITPYYRRQVDSSPLTSENITRESEVNQSREELSTRTITGALEKIEGEGPVNVETASDYNYSGDGSETLSIPEYSDIGYDYEPIYAQVNKEKIQIHEKQKISVNKHVKTLGSSVTIDHRPGAKTINIAKKDSLREGGAEKFDTDAQVRKSEFQIAEQKVAREFERELLPQNAEITMDAYKEIKGQGVVWMTVRQTNKLLDNGGSSRKIALPIVTKYVYDDLSPEEDLDFDTERSGELFSLHQKQAASDEYYKTKNVSGQERAENATIAETTSRQEDIIEDYEQNLTKENVGKTSLMADSTTTESDVSCTIKLKRWESDIRGVKCSKRSGDTSEQSSSTASIDGTYDSGTSRTPSQNSEFSVKSEIYPWISVRPKRGKGKKIKKGSSRSSLVRGSEESVGYSMQITATDDGPLVTQEAASDTQETMETESVSSSNMGDVTTLPWIEVRKKDSIKQRYSLKKKKYESKVNSVQHAADRKDRLLLLKIPPSMLKQMENDEKMLDTEVKIPWMELGQTTDDSQGYLPWVELTNQTQNMQTDRVLMLKISREMLLKASKDSTGEETEIQLPWNEVVKYWEETGQIAPGSLSSVGGSTNIVITFSSESTTQRELLEEHPNLPGLRLIMPKRSRLDSSLRQEHTITVDDKRNIKVRINKTVKRKHDWTTVLRLNKSERRKKYLRVAGEGGWIVLADGTQWWRLHVDDMDDFDKIQSNSEKSKFENYFEIGSETTDGGESINFNEFTKELGSKKQKQFSFVIDPKNRLSNSNISFKYNNYL